jgi:hypothetical protein
VTTTPPETRRWLSFPRLQLGLAGLLLAFVLIPPVRDNPRLLATFYGASAFLFAWVAILWIGAKRWGLKFEIEYAPPLKSHYIQASVQFTIYAYWGWYWRQVYAEAPLILAQLFFLYAFESLLTWSRGRKWRLGFGPLPVIFSTNLFLWFRDDWFYYQFLLVATCALGKEFIRWNRDGKSTHIFNPSAFGLGLFAVVLIATGTTTQLTWGVEVASTLALPPHIYLLIFSVGLVVQYFFSVTLMTLSAVASLCLLNLAYTGSTGVYQFVDTNVPIAVFLGLHLLMTDPATSPRSNAGRIMFGSLYGVGSFVLYGILTDLGAPEFYDKLLTVPLLNLSVQAIDRLSKVGWIGKFNRWEASFHPRKLNLVHMGCWVALFAVMLGSGYVEAPHAGGSIAFWRKAYEEGKPRAGEKLLRLLKSQTEKGSGEASNQLGLAYLEGKLVGHDLGAATHCFARACELGHDGGCANLTAQFFAQQGAQPGALLLSAMDRLEQECGKSGNGRNCFLIGFAHETGRGRPLDKSRALEFYQQGCARGNLDASKALARIRITGSDANIDLTQAEQILKKTCEAGDAQSCLYLSHLIHGGLGMQRDDELARSLLERACQLGSEQACAALKRSDHWMP